MRLIQNHLVDSRTGRDTQFPLADLFRQSAYSRLGGYEDLNDATRLVLGQSELKTEIPVEQAPTAISKPSWSTVVCGTSSESTSGCWSTIRPENHQ